MNTLCISNTLPQVWKGRASYAFNPNLICFLLIPILCANTDSEHFHVKVRRRSRQCNLWLEHQATDQIKHLKDPNLLLKPPWNITKTQTSKFFVKVIFPFLSTQTFSIWLCWTIAMMYNKNTWFDENIDKNTCSNNNNTNIQQKSARTK